MDRGTKIYAYCLLMLALGFAVWVLYEDPKVGELNRILAADAEIASYPYRFRVLRLEGRIAVMASPRSVDVPVQRVLGVLHPEVAGRESLDPAFQRAQQRLAAVQRAAHAIIVSQKEVDGVRWELDEGWLQQHGIWRPR